MSDTAAVDASALLAPVFGERLTVARGAFENGSISTVNLAEVLTKMVDAGRRGGRHGYRSARA